MIRSRVARLWSCLMWALLWRRWRSSKTRRRASRVWLVQSGKKVRIYDPVAGGEALLVIDVGEEVNALAVFADPATGAPRLASGSKTERCASSTRSRAARRCLCSKWARSECLGGLHGPGDGRAAARVRDRD